MEVLLLHYAVDKGHNEFVELLIENGADVNAKKVDGDTPLHAAAMNGHKAIAELLIENGADVNANSWGGWTPLHCAKTKEITELLLTNGADVNAKHDEGETPLDCAEEVYEDISPETKAAKKEIADLLRKHGGKTGEELKAEGK